jgi:hypothetical protein
MVVATSLFFASLAGLFALFSLKLWEASHGRTLLPAFRRTLDRGALSCKTLLIALEQIILSLPSILASLGLRTLVRGAVAFAQLARSASDAAHRLADFVSHKRNFERRETRSEFLKQVTEHQVRNQNDSQTNGKSEVANGIVGKRKRVRDADVRTL